MGLPAEKVFRCGLLWVVNRWIETNKGARLIAACGYTVEQAETFWRRFAWARLDADGARVGSSPAQ